MAGTDKDASSLSVIIPCKNEIDAIDAVWARFLQARQAILEQTSIQTVELLVVDDHSTDGSLEKLQRLAGAEGLRLIASPVDLGYGGALKIGLQASLGELVAFYDMDFTYDPMDLVAMIAHLEQSGVGMVCGHRLSKIEGMPWTRVVGNRFFVAVIHNIFHRKVADACTGMRVFRRRYIDAFLQLLPNNLNFTLAMTILFLRFQIPFAELPIRYHRRLGRSKLSLVIDGPRFLGTILWYWFSYKFHPRRIRLATGVLQGGPQR